MMRIHEILAHAELSEDDGHCSDIGDLFRRLPAQWPPTEHKSSSDAASGHGASDAHSAQGVVEHVVHDESGSDAHSVQGEDVAARSAHGDSSEDAAPVCLATEILKRARGAHGRRGPKARARQR